MGRKEKKKMTMTQTQPSTIMICSWTKAVGVGRSNTGSFTVPRYIDGAPVGLKSVPSYADFVTPSSYIAEKKRQLILKSVQQHSS